MVAFYAERNGLSVYQELKNNSISLIALLSWAGIEQYSGSNSLFDSHEAQEHTLFDCSGLEITKHSAHYFGSLELGEDVYCINRERTVFNAADKKLLKTAQSSIVELKTVDKTSLKNFVDEALEIEKYMLDQQYRTKIVQQSHTYDDVINLIYRIVMSEAPDKVLTEYQIVEEPALYMLSWRENSLKTDAPRWYSYVQPDQLQLALSLLMTKTLKWSPSDKRSRVIDELVGFDHQLKVYVRSDIIAFQAMLWKLMWV